MRKIIELESTPVFRISSHDFDHIIDYHCFIWNKYQWDHPYRIDITKKLLHGMALSLMGVVNNWNDDNINSVYHKNIINKFFKLLIEHSKEKKTANFFSDQLCLSNKYTSALILKYTGRSIVAWNNLAMTLHAKFLLKNTQLTILQISEELNFPNPSFFGRFFKRQTGLTPGEYRNI